MIKRYFDEEEKQQTNRQSIKFLALNNGTQNFQSTNERVRVVTVNQNTNAPLLTNQAINLRAETEENDIRR